MSVLDAIGSGIGVPIERRPLERTELLTATECGLAGTISELTMVDEIDGFRFATDGVLARLRRRYLQVMRGDVELPKVEMVKLLKPADLAASR
jgi:branched-chain amino acid aminotransferase